VLKPEGLFLVKAFHGAEFGEITARLKKHSLDQSRKPSASRGESAGDYVLARGLTGL
jgi:23S rRNA U2552 (ribose-2'-O)-methylase RlmE/FtsJ